MLLSIKTPLITEDQTSLLLLPFALEKFFWYIYRFDVVGLGMTDHKLCDLTEADLSV